MYEGARKYAVRSTSRIARGNGQHDGGTYTLVAAWQAAPVCFCQQAVRYWQCYRDEQAGNCPKYLI